MTLYAQWERKSGPTLSFDGNGADSGSVDSITVGAPEGETVTLPTRTGYLFTGWNTAADGTGVGHQPGNRVFLNANMTLIAQWQPTGSRFTTNPILPGGSVGVPYSATLEAVGADDFVWYSRTSASAALPPGLSLNSQTGEISGIPTVPGDYQVTLAARFGSLFVPAIDYITADFFITVIPESHPAQHTVIYDSNDGSRQRRTIGVVAGSSVTVPDSTTFLETRPGYTLTGWNTFADGTGTTHQPGDTLTPTASMMLYARWESIPPIDDDDGADVQEVTALIAALPNPVTTIAEADLVAEATNAFEALS